MTGLESIRHAHLPSSSNHNTGRMLVENILFCDLFRHYVSEQCTMLLGSQGSVGIRESNRLRCAGYPYLAVNVEGVKSLPQHMLRFIDLRSTCDPGSGLFTAILVHLLFDCLAKYKPI